MMWYSGFGWMGILGPLMMILFWGGIVLLVVWAFRFLPGTRGSAGDGAVDILKRRLASGEITQVEYEQARRALQG